MHVDEFIDFGTDRKDEAEVYARYVLLHFRFSAVCQVAFAKYIEPLTLFCTYEGKRYRVTGASRMGDIWLHGNLVADHGYELRVSPDQCTKWGKEAFSN